MYLKLDPLEHLGPNHLKTSSSWCSYSGFHLIRAYRQLVKPIVLFLSSTSREYRKDHYDEVVLHYYNVFNRTLAEFGLVLRHLGTTYQDFLYEVKRALRGQFLCVAFIIPIGKTHPLIFNMILVYELSPYSLLH